MSARVLLNVLNELGENRSNAKLVEHFISFSQRVTSFFFKRINSIIQKHEC